MPLFVDRIENHSARVFAYGVESDEPGWSVTVLERLLDAGIFSRRTGIDQLTLLDFELSFAWCYQNDCLVTPIYAPNWLFVGNVENIGVGTVLKVPEEILQMLWLTPAEGPVRGEFTLLAATTQAFLSWQEFLMRGERADGA